MKRTQEEILSLYEEYYDMVWRICVMQFGNSHDAYDATQETFIRLMNYPKDFLNKEHEKAWLIRTAINYCKDVRKSSQRKRVIFQDVGQQIQENIVPDMYSDVFETLKELPEKYRAILYLYYYEGYSLKEIAAMLKINASTLRSRFAKAKAVMKEYLEDEG